MFFNFNISSFRPAFVLESSLEYEGKIFCESMLYVFSSEVMAAEPIGNTKGQIWNTER